MRQEEFKMDSRTVEDIKNEIGSLAKSYTPEWNFNPANPDIGSVLALIFANQMSKNVDRFNTTLDRYRTELVNLMDISPHPAKAAETTVLMEISSEAEEGIPVPAGSRLFANTEEENIVFETAFPIYLTPARLRTIFMTSGETGRVLSLMGSLKKKAYIEESSDAEEIKREENIKPFSLFQFAREGIERQAVVLYHSTLFDIENEAIYCKIEGNGELLKGIEEGRFRFLYYTEEGFLPVESTKVMGNHILLLKNKPNQKVVVDRKEYSVFVLEALEPQSKYFSVDSISFSSAGSLRPADYVGNGTTDYDVNRFYLFGDMLSLFSECYIGMDAYFAKKDAKISLSFKSTFEEHFVGYTPQEEQEHLKIIKRKPKAASETYVTYTYAEEISIEYYNGLGWKRIPCEQEYKKMFAEAQEGEYQITFQCPKDWEETGVGAYNGRMLRIQLLRADNCYYQPCYHKLPILSELMISYTYEEHFENPEIAHVFSGTTETNITRKLQEHRPVTLFSKGNHEDTALYLGFDKTLAQGPIGLWWQVEGEQRKKEIKLRFYCSTIHGFKEMKVIDQTANLSRSGIMMFLPPADITMTEMEGQRCCWIKIMSEDDKAFDSNIVIQRIVLNGVKVKNIETLEEEDFYLEAVDTKMEFGLQASGILDAEVWVNETGELSKERMEQMIEETPDRVRVERNPLGEISEFFVKWTETRQFYQTTPEDRHYILDRMNGKLIFGNGVKVKVPKYLDGVAFTVKLRCCNGKKGNVPADSITNSSRNWLFLQSITNPEPAYGGADMEPMERVLQRGASLLSSRNRFVTPLDYEREVMHFSDNIDKASIISGVGKDGSYHERRLYVVLLLKDYQKGKNSFYRMKDELKEHLLEHCELSITSKELFIEEPVYVEFHVDVWAGVVNIENSFEIQNAIKGILEQYLNPISADGTRGWQIGELPRKSQILMRLNSLKGRAIIQHMVITAKYEDDDGVHEVDLDNLNTSPYMIAVNGIHNVHVSLLEEM